MDGFEVEALWLLCPGLAAEFIECETLQGLLLRRLVAIDLWHPADAMPLQAAMQG